MLRRALFGSVFGIGAGTLLASADGTVAFAAALNAGLRSAVAEPTDWDALAADFSRRHVLAPNAEFGHELAGQLLVAQNMVARGDKDAARGAAMLSLTYGLWIGDAGRIPTAHSLYNTAAALADRSGDKPTRALVRARAANRGIYEGWTAQRAQTAVDQALAISTTGTAALEAYAALVHLHALTGNLQAGRDAVRKMRQVAMSLDETDSPSAAQRVASFHTYLECRSGTIQDAERAYGETQPLLRNVPLWRADASIYMSRALVAAGRVQEGAEMALEAISTMPFSTRILGIGVRDVLSVAGEKRTDALDALRGYAVAGPTPWETIK